MRARAFPLIEGCKKRVPCSRDGAARSPKRGATERAAPLVVPWSCVPVKVIMVWCYLLDIRQDFMILVKGRREFPRAFAL